MVGKGLARRRRSTGYNVPGLGLNIYGRLTEAGDSHRQPSDTELGAIVKQGVCCSPNETRACRPQQYILRRVALSSYQSRELREPCQSCWDVGSM